MVCLYIVPNHLYLSIRNKPNRFLTLLQFIHLPSYYYDWANAKFVPYFIFTLEKQYDSNRFVLLS